MTEQMWVPRLSRTEEAPMMAEAIVRMAEQGFRIFPLVERTKKPYIPRWPERATTDLEQIRKWTEEDLPGCNIAVACGAGSSDVRGEGGFVVAPPSFVTPPSNAKEHLYHWVDEQAPILPAPQWLLEKLWALERSRGTKLCPSVARPTPAGEIPEGHRNGALTSIAGTMRRRGVSVEAIEAALLADNAARCNPPLPAEEVRNIARSVARYAPSLLAPNAQPHLVTLPEVTAASPADDRWPEPQPLGSELLPVERFSLEFLPSSFRPLVDDTSERMQTPPDFAAADALVCLAGCVNRRAAIRPKRRDDWTVVPNLWGAIVAQPGFLKSPVMQAITQPLKQIEELWRKTHEQEASDFELEREKVELAHQAWKEQYKSAVKRGGPRPVAPDGSLSEPKPKRLIVMDATFEKLHEILSDNPAGVVAIRDELTGWLGELEKPGRESERAFYLQGWNGDGSFNIDRIGRGTIHVPAVCISLLGNIQPNRLRAYMRDTLSGGPGDDGLIQRFQILVWPDVAPTWRNVDREPNYSASRIAHDVFTRLASLSPDIPIELRFAPDAQELFDAWRIELESKIRGEHGLHPAVVAHLSKYRSLLPSLAGLFELADLATEGGNLEGYAPITLEHTRQAAELCDYLESHAVRVYGCMVSPEMASARELGRHIAAGDLSDTFTTRDVYRRGWSGLTQPEQARNALELLADLYWILEQARTPGDTGGRPTEVWQINPRVKSHAQ